MNTESPVAGQQRRSRRRSDGERSRAAILNEAARLATVDGLSGLSIARLAAAVGMSKSGLFAHFGSKEELQLATVEMADSIFTTLVIEPGSTAPTAIERLRALADGYLHYVEAETFPGGCFFASALIEMSMQPGLVHDRLVGFLGGWLARLQSTVRDAQAEGTIDPGEDPAQIAFEVEAALFLANAQYVVTHSAEPIERARRTIDQRLASATSFSQG